ncbi:hypothetical protein GWK47_047009 [Chionoecetes opilio]|uniref:Uncharacterized protein n=1 Tax=Chionoecetes opilio TaxID=41210 RepID=A0A8J5CTA3_CHIOP|nr:hypothetical protein GWK47_047009 [Chionoecetes opilio]
MLISRRQRPPDTPIPTILLGGKPVPLHTSISILGVEVNSVLTFTDHIQTIARKAAWKLSCVRRVIHLLDSQGITTLYAAQVRSLMEYAPLTWSSCPPTYLSLLDKDGDLSAVLPSALHKNVEPHGTADTASLYLVTPDLQKCCERLDKAAIVLSTYL